MAEIASEAALPGKPKYIDHRKHPGGNPCESMCGVNWKQEVLNHPEMRAIVDVRELVEHMVNTGEEQYAETRYCHMWGFYHDALSLMSSHENLEWMRRMDYLHHWIIPQHELNSMFTHYQRPMPVGNHAGAMPWDNSCNKDLDDAVLRHVAATVKLDGAGGLDREA